jgi:hypothetical protein
VTESSAVADLRAALSLLAPEAADSPTAALAVLRARVCAVVDEMKLAGVPPEGIVVAVKTLASDNGIRRTNKRLFEQLVSWSVERYYAEG